jgi:hypothetical protein
MSIPCYIKVQLTPAMTEPATEPAIPDDPAVTVFLFQNSGNIIQAFHPENMYFSG